MSFVHKDDTVTVHSMNRLARNLDNMHQLMQNHTKRGGIEFVKDCLTYTCKGSPMAVMDDLAEFIRDRTTGNLVQPNFGISTKSLASTCIEIWSFL